MKKKPILPIHPALFDMNLEILESTGSTGRKENIRNMGSEEV